MTVPGGGWPGRIGSRLERVAVDGRYRTPRGFDALGPEGQLTEDGRPVVTFASNDYLGLTAHPAVVAAAHDALDRWGTGAGASRLITGSRPVHADLEAALATHRDTEDAVCFSSGFAANLGVLTVLGGPGVRIVSDELNHASIIDGCRLSRAEVAVYRHADPEHAAALLSSSEAPAMLVTDTVFSMDGDVAPLVELAEVCRRADALMVLDEAHAVLGPEVGPEVTDDLTVVRVGTLSKTLGSLGGYVAAPRAITELLVNLARPYIFTTALTPADAAAALAALAVFDSPEGDALRARLAGHVQRVRPGHSTPIVPVVLGSEERALAGAEALLERGLWVPAIRPPTVPPNTSRLRVTLSAAHTDEQVSQLVAALASLDPVPEAVAR
jgi:8-amino-7-oxononanoate synthase